MMMHIQSISWNSPSGQTALEAIHLLTQAGGRPLLVGGCVRDALLNLPGKDFDIEVYGLTLEEIRTALAARFEFSSVGASFGVLKLHHADVDIALPRTENKIGFGHRGFLVTSDPNLPMEVAARRRDFTVNAIMYDPLQDQLIDPLHGIEDLQNRILRHCSDHFSEDPLRVLRAMQFLSRFPMTAAPETIQLCSTLSQNELPAERLAGEWEKMLLKGTRISDGLRFLQACGWIRFYPELQRLIDCRQSPKWHPEGDVWNHTLKALDALPELRCGKRFEDLTVALGTLCHDFGKPDTSSVGEDGQIHSYNHPVAGLPHTETFFRRIWNETSLLEQILPLVQYHMEPISFIKNDCGPKAYRRLALKARRLDLLYKVAVCDMKGTYPRNEDLANLEIFLQRAKELQLENRQPLPILKGHHLIQLGIKPGPAMGQMLQKAFEAQLDGKFNTLQDAFTWFEENR